MIVIRIETLARHHAVDAFDCGHEALNRFLSRYALQNQFAEASRTYVAVSDGEVVGYHTLVFGEVACDDAPERLIKGVARYPVPVMVLARLAVARGRQGQGLGAGILRDALFRTAGAADIAGLRAFAVHARDDRARAFYEHFDLEPARGDPLHLMLPMKTLRALIR